MQKADINEIYNLLFAGKKLKLDFPSAYEAERFRVTFHRFKTRQEKSLVDIGLLNEHEVSIFSFKPYQSKVAPSGEVDLSINSWLLSFTDRPTLTKFNITILDDGEEDSDGS